MQRRFVLGILAIFAALAAISMVSFYQNRELYLEVDDLLAGGAELPAEVVRAAELQPDSGTSAGASLGPRIQLRGLVDKRSTDRGADGLEMGFDLYGQKGAVPVYYRGVVPDTFDMAETVTVSGQITDSGVFLADELLVQCPSKYEAVPPGKQPLPTADD